MSHIRISRSHTLGVDQAREVLSEIAEELAEEHKVSSVWEGTMLRIKGRGLSGHLEVHATKIEIEARLGLTMRPFKRTLEKELVGLLDEHLGQES